MEGSNMHAVTIQAGRVLDLLGAKAKEAGGVSATIDHGAGYMPVHVEWISLEMLSVAHYGEQNGDLMRDPDMVFWHGPDGKWYPATFRNDYTGTSRDAIVFADSGRPRGFYAREQATQASFAKVWMANICEQQGLAPRPRRDAGGMAYIRCDRAAPAAERQPTLALV